MNQSTPSPSSHRPMPVQVLPDGAARKRLRRWRGFKDSAAKYSVGAFGMGVILALALIFIYLFSEVLPMLRPAAMTVYTSYEAPGGRSADTVHMAMDRHELVGVRYTTDRQAVFFDVADGSERYRETLPLPADATVTTFGLAEPRTRLVICGLDNGQALLVRHDFNERFSPDGRQYDPTLEFPLGEGDAALLNVAEDGASIAAIAVQRGSTGTSVAAALEDGRMRLLRFEERSNFMTGAVTVRQQAYDIPALPDNAQPRRILLDITMRNLLVGDDQGRLHYYDVSRPAQAQWVESKRVTLRRDAQVQSMEYLLGTVSVIVGGSDGTVSQWMLVRDEDNVNRDRKSTRLNSSHVAISYAVFCLKKKKNSRHTYHHTSQRCSTPSSLSSITGPQLTLSFFYPPPPPSTIYTLSLHDALPIYLAPRCASAVDGISARDGFGDCRRLRWHCQPMDVGAGRGQREPSRFGQTLR